MCALPFTQSLKYRFSTFRILKTWIFKESFFLTCAFQYENFHGMIIYQHQILSFESLSILELSLLFISKDYEL